MATYEYLEEFNGVPIKSFDQILSEILADWQSNTLVSGIELDVRPYSDAHIRASAIAQQIHAAYVSGAMSVNQYMPDTAKGIYLENHAKAEGITKKLPTKAKGLQLQYKRDPNMTRIDVEVTIESGIKVVTKRGVVFESTQAVTMAPNVVEAVVPYQAVEAGETGNIQPGEIYQFYGQPPAGINFVTNLDATKDGADEEDDETLRGRYFDATQQEDWHGSPAWAEHEAKKIDGITSATAIKNARGEGTMDVLVTSGDGIPSQEKLNEVQAYLTDPVREPINVDLRVIAPEGVVIPLTVQAPGLTQTQAEDAYKAYLASVGSGAAVYPSRIVAALINAGASFTIVQQPASAIVLSKTQMPLPGVVTLV